MEWRIAAAAAKILVKEGQSVVLDSGSTTTAVARALREFQHLTIITNAINIASELSGTTLDVILTGGTLRANSYSLVGPIAEESLRRLTGVGKAVGRGARCAIRRTPGGAGGSWRARQMVRRRQGLWIYCAGQRRG